VQTLPGGSAAGGTLTSYIGVTPEPNRVDTGWPRAGWPPSLATAGEPEIRFQAGLSQVLMASRLRIVAGWPTRGGTFVTTTVTEAEQVTAAEAVDLVKVYGSGQTAVVALHGVTVAFPAGKLTAIMGPSGSGKSKLMHCLAGLDTVTSGEVYVGGQALSALNDRRLTELRRDRVGFVLQQYNLLPR